MTISSLSSPLATIRNAIIKAIMELIKLRKAAKRAKRSEPVDLMGISYTSHV